MKMQSTISRVVRVGSRLGQGTARIAVLSLVLAAGLWFNKAAAKPPPTPGAGSGQSTAAVLAAPAPLLYGCLKWEAYTNINGITLTDLTNHASFPSHPSVVRYPTLFEAPEQFDDDFGARLSGFVLPRTTGYYTFYLASDDQGALFLSSNEDPAGKTQIAFEPRWRAARQWTDWPDNPTNSNISAPIWLQAGRRYYVEALMKEGGGGDNLAVAWQKPGDLPPANGSMPIAGEFLATWPDTNNQPPQVAITLPVSGTVFLEPATVEIEADVTDPDGVCYRAEFFANGVRIGESTISIEAVPPAGTTTHHRFAWSNVLAGSYSLTARAQDAKGAAGVSAPVLITVQAPEPAGRELHVVGVYSGTAPGGGSSTNHEQGQASLVVNRPGQQVTLFLSALEPVLWHVAVSEGTIIEKVFLAGYYRQQIDGLPAGVEIVPAWLEGRSGEPYIWIGYAIESSVFYYSISRINEMTGQPISSFHGGYQAPFPAQIVIDAVQNDPRLSASYPEPVSPSAVPSLGFSVAFRGESAGSDAVRSQSYTLQGPTVGTKLGLGTRVVADQTGRYYFGLGSQGMLMIDSQTGVSRELLVPPGLPELSWPMGVAFDSGRERALLVSMGAEGILYAYAPGPAQWSLVTSMNGRDLNNLVYHPAQDALYGVKVLHGDGLRSSLYRFSAQGVYQSEFDLPYQPFGYGLHGFPSELVSVGNYLVWLVEARAGTGGSGTPAESRIYLIDPRSRQVWLTYRKVEQATAVQLSWPSPAPIVYGTPLSTAQLNATANVGGTFTYYPTLGSVLHAGIQTLTCTFYPATSGAAPVATNVFIQVNRAPLTVHADDLTRFQGQVNPLLTATFSGLANGDTPELWNAMDYLSTVAAPDSLPGSYSIDVADFAPSDYILTRVSGTLTVLPARTEPGAVDLSFDGQVGGVVYALAPQPDGRVLIGGDFRTVRGQPRNGLARLWPDGNLDYAFSPDNDYLKVIHSVAPRADGKVMVAGFASINETHHCYLARLFENGALDASFAVVTNKYWDFQAIAVQNDGKTLVVGSRHDASSSGLILRFNEDGSPDGGFNVGAGPDQNWLSAVAVQNDGRILVTGTFANFDGQPRQSIVRLNSNGSVDTSFQPPSMMGSGIAGLALQPDGRVLVGGYSLTPGELALVLRLTSDGSLDPTFATLSEADGTVAALAVQPDGRILMGGGFSEVNSVARRGLARLNEDGSLDGSFDPGMGILGGDDWVNAIVVQSSARAWIGGGFATVDQVPRTGLVRLIIGGPTAPVVTEQPGSLTRFVGQTAVLNVTAAGVPPLYYVWMAGGEAIVGAYSSTLWLPNLGTDDIGFYEVQVANAFGAVLSDQAFVDVIPPAYSGPGAVDFSFDLSGNGQKVGLAGGPTTPYSLGFPCCVYGMALAPDGRIIIGGDFVGVNGLPRMNYARLQSSGAVDRSLDASWGTDGEVRCVVRQDDGRILIGGNFSMINGVRQGNLARLEPDGRVDMGFRPSLVSDSSARPVGELLLQSDGKIVVYGSFTNVNGVAQNWLARLRQDGALDSSFVVTVLSNQMSCYVSGVALEPDGRLLAFGSFPDLKTWLIRLNMDGSLDSTFHPAAPGAGQSVTPFAVTVQADGKIVAAYGYPCKVARMHADGSLDASFQQADRIDGLILRMLVQPDGKIVLGGDFSKVLGAPRWHIARLNADGTLDAGFQPGDPMGASDDSYSYLSKVWTLALQPDGKILAGGVAQGPRSAQDGLFRLATDGSRDLSFEVNISPGHVAVQNLVALPDGKVLVNGNFQWLSGEPQSLLARLNVDGSVDPSFVPETPGADTLSLLARLSDGRLLVSGWFTNELGGGLDLLRLTADGAADPTFTPPLLDGYEIKAAAVQSDGKIVIGGSLWAIEGAGRHYVGRLNADGSLDTSFVPADLDVGDDWYITGVGVQRDGKIVVSGQIFKESWSTYYGLARLNPDGSQDMEFRARVEVNGPVFQMLLQPDDKILFTGEFSDVNGHSAVNLARLNPDGTFDTSFQPPSGQHYFSRLGLAPDGKILVSSQGKTIRLNPDGSVDPRWRCDGEGELAVCLDGSVMLGGDFRSIDGVPVYGVARLHGDLEFKAPVTSMPVTHQTCFEGRKLSLRVDACGSGALNYQWLFNGAPIAGANSATLVFEPAQTAQSGDYSVVVANSAGAVTSAVAHVDVIDAPATPGSVDISFDPTAGGQRIGLSSPDVSVHCVVRLADGKYLVGGAFVGVNGRSCQHLARLLPSGGVDESFDTSLGPDGTVTGMAVQPNGQILILGAFNRVNTHPRSQIARLNADASFDASFAPVVEGSIYTMAVQTDGRVLIGGDFTKINGVGRMNLARLMPDGSLDTSFDPGSSLESPSAAVNDIKVQPDGRILLAGWFYPAEPVRYVVRLLANGSLDSSFQADMNGWGWWCGATTLALLPDGKIYVSGGQVARLNADGSLDTAFNPDPSAPWVAYGAWIKTLLVQEDGKLVIGGSFDHVQWESCFDMARLNPDGTVDEAFYQDNCLPQFSMINVVEPTPDGGMMVGAGLPSEHAEWCPCLVRLSQNGWWMADFRAKPQGHNVTVEHLALTSANQAVIAGSFDAVNGVARPHLARLNTDGTLDAGFAPPATEAQIRCLAVHPDGRVVVGFYREVGGLVSGWLERYNNDGSPDDGFASTVSGKIYSLFALPDGRLLVGGWFNLPDGRSHLVRLNEDGSVDDTFFAEGVYASDDFGVSAIAVQRDGKILIRGEIFREDMGAQGLMRLHPDGSSDVAFNTKVQVSGYPGIILIQPDDKIVVPENGSLVRLHPDGTVDGAFQPPTEGFTPLAMQPNGQIVGSAVCGFQRLNLDGGVDPAFCTPAYPYGNLRVAAVQSDGQFLVAGAFCSIGGLPFHAIARLHGGNAAPQPWVVRHIGMPLPLRPGPFCNITLQAQPPASVGVYAVEDCPPAGWWATNISHGGVFDPQTGKVKFGPFFDAETRALSYGVVAPSAPQGVYVFSGVVSADGVNFAIGGDQHLVIVGCHPAEMREVRPADWRMTVEEVTAYASAWRHGLNWVVPPNPIPVDYVTRAAALWRGGECYQVDPSVTNAPMWWVNCPTFAVQMAAGVSSPAASSAVSLLPAMFVPGEPVAVRVNITPGTIGSSYAVEDRPPEGWTIASISSGGGFDPVNGRVKWGPFFDGQPRTLSYEATPPVETGSVVNFAGVASFDGSSVPIAGARQLRASSRLQVGASPQPGRVELRLRGQPGVRYVIETSTDLVRWEALDSVSCDTGQARASMAVSPSETQRFYRARPLP